MHAGITVRPMNNFWHGIECVKQLLFLYKQILENSNRAPKKTLYILICMKQLPVTSRYDSRCTGENLSPHGPRATLASPSMPYV